LSIAKIERVEIVGIAWNLNRSEIQAQLLDVFMIPEKKRAI